jgi:hypothetical protein
MPVFVRRFSCAVCGQNVYWDKERQILTCGCGSYKASFVNEAEFIELPKYDRKFWKSETFPIDCAKFLHLDMETLHISDRNSIFMGNENPQLTLRWIHYPQGDKVQLCLAISGSFHTEKIAYNQKDPNAWKERMWIFLPPEILPKIIAWIQKNPQALASWM